MAFNALLFPVITLYIGCLRLPSQVWPRSPSVSSNTCSIRRAHLGQPQETCFWGGSHGSDRGAWCHNQTHFQWPSFCLEFSGTLSGSLTHIFILKTATLRAFKTTYSKGGYFCINVGLYNYFEWQFSGTLSGSLTHIFILKTATLGALKTTYSKGGYFSINVGLYNYFKCQFSL